MFSSAISPNFAKLKLDFAKHFVFREIGYHNFMATLTPGSVLYLQYLFSGINLVRRYSQRGNDREEMVEIK
jgi:hypothetical protein